jgi:DNA-binding transcriptional ArsR family regulator
MYKLNFIIKLDCTFRWVTSVRDVLFIEEQAVAATLLQPLRLSLLQRMAVPRTCLELAAELGEAPQKVYYHVKVLERAGLVDKVSERRVRGINEGIYQAGARSYWLSSHLVKRLGGPRTTRDQVSLGYLLNLAEQLQSEVGHLAEAAVSETASVPSLGVAAQIRLRDAADRGAFLSDLQESIQALARKYGRQGATGSPSNTPGEMFRLLVACYPAPASADD